MLALSAMGFCWKQKQAKRFAHVMLGCHLCASNWTGFEAIRSFYSFISISYLQEFCIFPNFMEIDCDIFHSLCNQTTNKKSYLISRTQQMLALIVRVDGEMLLCKNKKFSINFFFFRLYFVRWAHTLIRLDQSFVPIKRQFLVCSW